MKESFQLHQSDKNWAPVTLLLSESVHSLVKLLRSQLLTFILWAATLLQAKQQFRTRLLLTGLDRKMPEVTTLDVSQAWRTGASPALPSRISLRSTHAPGFAREVWYYGCLSCLKAES